MPQSTDGLECALASGSVVRFWSVVRGIAVLAFFLGVYPQPLLTLVQQAGLVG